MPNYCIVLFSDIAEESFLRSTRNCSLRWLQYIPFQIDSINIKRSLLVSKSTKHLLRRLNPIIDSLQTAGAYEKLQKRYFANCSEFELRDNWWIGISLQDAATVFYFLFVGCGSAIAILIIELFIKPFLHCKKRL